MLSLDCGIGGGACSGGGGDWMLVCVGGGGGGGGRSLPSFSTLGLLYNDPWLACVVPLEYPELLLAGDGVELQYMVGGATCM